jgi:hydroxymethylpyrimidine pyrophosphatase-like HAD family hydrolase
VRYHVLATDYDGTLAKKGFAGPDTIAALERLKETGRRLVMVTGRELDELMTVFPQVELFDRIVAENGALLYCPATKEERVLGAAPPAAFAEELERLDVPISKGRVIVATREPHERVVLDTLRTLGLECQVIFNKGAVMVLPSGVNKATGLAAALDELGLSLHNTVGVGDAENDHAFLRACECGVAVANALPATKEQAHHVTQGAAGAGVVELCDGLLAEDLASVDLSHLAIDLGTDADEQPVRFDPYRECILLAGTSGGGKSTIATGIIERLAEQRYQFCVIDPEGDYGILESATALGDAQRIPSADEVLDLLRHPDRNAVVNLLGLKLEDRPPFFHTLLHRLREMRGRTGRPHWLIVDETHHLMPTAWKPTSLDTGDQLHGVLFITVHPDQISTAVLDQVSTAIAIGHDPHQVLEELAGARNISAPRAREWQLEPGEGILWHPGSSAAKWFKSIPPKTERRRHVRKYAEGDLGEERSFFFRGPDNKLNLRAQNLSLFLQLGDGVDDETWLHHLREGDYAAWFRRRIKDDSLADEVAQLEQERGLTADEGRKRLREIVEQRYTAPE